MGDPVYSSFFTNHVRNVYKDELDLLSISASNDKSTQVTFAPMNTWLRPSGLLQNHTL